MIYIFLFLISFFLTYIMKNIAIKRSLLDIPNKRSSHSNPVPHGGGVAIASTWFVSLIYLFESGYMQKELFYALFAGAIISVVGYLDDLYSLNAKIRLFFQFFIAFLGLCFLGGFRELDFFVFSIENQIFTNLFALFMIVWFINLYNFLDGIDGYAGSESVFLGIAGFFLFGDKFFLAFIASVFGFLFWNWQKAKIFMGDVGSTLLGYNIAIFTIYYADKNPPDFWVWIILFSLFWFDATLTLFRRFKNAQRLSIAHKKHAYQRLNQSGWTHSRVVVASIFVNIILFMSAYMIKIYQDLSLPMLFLVIIMLYMLMLNIDKRERFV